MFQVLIIVFRKNLVVSAASLEEAVDSITRKLFTDSGNLHDEVLSKFCDFGKRIDYYYYTEVG